MKPVKFAAKARLERAAAGTAVTGSRFRSARSQREERERREADATAEVYASFVESFQADDAESKSFVRGGTLHGGQEASNSAAPKRYTLKAKQPKSTPTKHQSSMVMAFGDDGSDSDNSMNGMGTTASQSTRGRGAGVWRPSSSTPAKPAASGGQTPLSGMDQLLADMKADADRGIVAGQTSFGDVDSTNLFVGNISPQATEEDLVARFAVHGPLLSAKVMWPRSASEEARGYNNGFVCFAFREDADAALRALDGATVRGARLSVSWAKGIPPASYDTLLQAARARGEDCRPRQQRLSSPAPPAKGLRGDRHVPRPEDAPLHTPPVYGEDHPLVQSARAAAAASPPPNVTPRQVPWPASAVRRRVLDRCAAYVAVDGYPLEQALIKQEAARQSTSEYGFLFQPDSAEGMYYRWRTYACVCGEGFHSWREAPFQLEAGGEWWTPPPVPAGHDGGCDSDASWGSWLSEGEGGESRAAQDPPHSAGMPAQGGRAGKGALPLSVADKATWNDMLDALVPSSESVGTAMVWGIRHASSAQEVVALVLRRLADGLPQPAQAAPWSSSEHSSLDTESTSTAQRLACVYLLGDLLCNAEAKAPHALAYARAVQSALPEAFHYMGHLLNEMAVHCGRMSAAGLRERLVRVLHAWGGGSVLPPPFLLGLEAALVWRGASSDDFLALQEAYTQRGEQACADVGVDEEALAAACRQVGCPDGGPTVQLLLRLLAVRAHGGVQLAQGSTIPTAVQQVVEEGMTPAQVLEAAARGEDASTVDAPLPPAVDQDAIPDLSGWKPSLRYNRHKRGPAQTRQRAGAYEAAGGGASDEEDAAYEGGDNGKQGGFIRVELAADPAAAMSAAEALTIADVHDAEIEAAEQAAAAAAATLAAAEVLSDSDPGEEWEHEGALDGGPLTAADEAFLAAAGWVALPTLPPPPPAPPVGSAAAGTAALPLPPPPPPADPPSQDLLGLPPPPSASSQ